MAVRELLTLHVLLGLGCLCPASNCIYNTTRSPLVCLYLGSTTTLCVPLNLQVQYTLRIGSKTPRPPNENQSTAGPEQPEGQIALCLCKYSNQTNFKGLTLVQSGSKSNASNNNTSDESVQVCTISFGDTVVPIIK